MWGKEPIGGPFALVDHTGKPRTDADFRGKLMLVYFGFSFCPDVCPTDLMAIGQASTSLAPTATRCSRCSSLSIPNGHAGASPTTCRSSIRD